MTPVTELDFEVVRIITSCQACRCTHLTIVMCRNSLSHVVDVMSLAVSCFILFSFI